MGAERERERERERDRVSGLFPAERGGGVGGVIGCCSLPPRLSSCVRLSPSARLPARMHSTSARVSLSLSLSFSLYPSHSPVDLLSVNMSI